MGMRGADWKFWAAVLVALVLCGPRPVKPSDSFGTHPECIVAASQDFPKCIHWALGYSSGTRANTSRLIPGCSLSARRIA